MDDTSLQVLQGALALPISSMTDSRSMKVLWEPWAPVGFIAFT